MPKRTTDFHADLLEDLADPRESEAYLNAALEDSEEMFLVALRDVAEFRRCRLGELDELAIVSNVYWRASPMMETLSIRIDAETKKRLEALSKRSKLSKSFLAAEGIASYVESEEWQLGELRDGIEDLDFRRDVGHEKISKWLKSWGKRGETKAPR